MLSFPALGFSLGEGSAMVQLSRRFEKDWRPHVKKLARVIGEVAIASNLLHAVFAAIFWRLIDPSSTDEHIDQHMYVSIDQIYAIWNVAGSDSAQRDMLMAAANNALPAKAAMLEEIRWMKLKADSLGKIRNDAIHLIVRLDRASPPRLAPALVGMPETRKARLMAEKNMERRFRDLVGDLNALHYYAIAVFFELSDSSSAPLPKRPKLRCAPNQK